MKRISIVIVIGLACVNLYAQDAQVEQLQPAEQERPAEQAGKDTRKQAADTTTADEIVVSARGYDKPVSSTPGGVGIITGKTIEKTNPVSVSDALEQIPGVYKSSDGSWGSEVSIRGASRDKVILLIDGSRINTATDIGAQFGTLNPLSVEKIEVLKGPISSLYGSGTIGGVVNVITRNGSFTDTPGFRSGITLSGESNAPAFNSYGFTSYNSRSWYVFGSGGYRIHNSYTDGGGTKVINSDFSDAQGTVNMGVKPAANHALEIKTQYYHGWDIGIPGAKDVVPTTAIEAGSPLTRRALVSADYTYKPGNDYWKKSLLHMYWQYLGRSMQINNPSTSTFVKLEPEADHNTYGMNWSNTINAGEQVIVAGSEVWFRTYRGERIKYKVNGTYVKEKPLPDCSFLSAGLFAEDDWTLGDFTLNLGARGDYILVSNDKTYRQTDPLNTANYWSADRVHDYSWNAHMGLTYYIIEQLSTSGLAASGYRAASLEERYKYIALAGGVEKYGNPDLDPERSFFFEYGLHLKTNRVTSNASAYANIMRDLIADIQTSATRYDLQNVNRALLWGTEYDIEVRVIEWIALYGDLTWIRGRDTKKDENLPSIAPLRLTGGVRFHTWFGLAGFFDTVYTAEQNKVPSGYKKSPDWVRLDTGLSYTVKFLEAEHRVFVTCTNLLDTEYYDYLTMSKTGLVFNEPGRSFKTGYSVLF